MGSHGTVVIARFDAYLLPQILNQVEQFQGPTQANNGQRS